MAIGKKILSRNNVSIALLFLVLLRLVPFNLLHYHNGVFASFKASTNIFISENNSDYQLAEKTSSCSFHQFLDLINHAFSLDATFQYVTTSLFGNNQSIYFEGQSTDVAIYILNKGSPMLA